MPALQREPRHPPPPLPHNPSRPRRPQTLFWSMCSIKPTAGLFICPALLPRLRRRQTIFWLMVSIKLTVGLLMSLLGPALLATIMPSILNRTASPWDPSWPLLFWFSCPIAIPILYFIEWQTRGEFLMNEL